MATQAAKNVKCQTNKNTVATPEILPFYLKFFRDRIRAVLPE